MRFYLLSLPKESKASSQPKQSEADFKYWNVGSEEGPPDGQNHHYNIVETNV